MQLHSRFSADERSFSGGSACDVPAGFAACRELTADELAAERLLPGDQLLVRESFHASAVGTNLRAEVKTERDDVTDVLPGGSTVSTDFTRDGQPLSNPVEISGSDPEAVQNAEWQVRTTITSPRQWPVSFESQKLSLSSLTVTVEQLED